MPDSISKNVHIYFFTTILALMPFICVLSPRSMAFLPGVVGLFGFFSSWFVYKIRPVIIKEVLFLVSAIIFLAALSSLWSLDSEGAFNRTLKMALVLLPSVLFVSFLKAQDRQFRRLLAIALPVGIGLALSFSWVELNFYGPFYKLFRGLPQDYDYNKSNLNRGVVTISLIAFAGFVALQLTDLRKNSKILISGLYILSLFVVFSITHSQSAHLAFAIGVVAFIGFPAQYKFSWALIATMLISLLLVAPWLVQIAFKVAPDLIRDVSWFENSYSLERLEIWDFIARYAMQSPFIGHGIEVTRAVESFDTAMLYHHDDTILHPHNFALQIWIEFGLLGVVLTTAFFIWVLRYIRSQEPVIIKMYLATFFAFLSVASTGYGLWQSWWLGTMFLGSGYCLIMAQRYQDKRIKEEPQQ